MTKEHKHNLIAEFRYSIIAELCNPYLSKEEKIRMIAEKSSREYELPFSLRTRVSKSCIKRWLALYQKSGKSGLLPSVRNDHGKSRCLKEEEQESLISFLERKPEVTATNAYKHLVKEGKIKSGLSQSSLSRLVVNNQLRKKDRSAIIQDDISLKFAFYRPLECVQADVMHAFLIPDAKGIKRKAMLMAFIDDATRRILYSDFAFSEASIMFEKGVKHILKAHGKIGKLYVDNGSSFVSNQTKRIMDILGIPLIHSKPYRPKGRGKIERFFRTVREQFLRLLDPSTIPSIAKLNTDFKIWLEGEYHRNPHRGLDGETPLLTWLSKTQHIIPMPKDIDLDAVFLHELTRKVYNDATITLYGVLYEVPPILIGKTIKIRFNPEPPITTLFVCHKNKDFGKARIVDTYANTKIKRSIDSKEFIPLEHSKNVTTFHNAFKAAFIQIKSKDGQS